jgi:hypothetical protein
MLVKMGQELPGMLPVGARQRHEHPGRRMRRHRPTGHRSQNIFGRPLNQAQATGHPTRITSNTSRNLSEGKSETLMNISDDPRLFDRSPVTLFRIRKQMKKRLSLSDLTNIRTNRIPTKFPDGRQPYEPVNEHQTIFFRNNQHRRDLIESLDRPCNHVYPPGPRHSSMRMTQIQTDRLQCRRCV